MRPRTRLAVSVFTIPNRLKNFHDKRYVNLLNRNFAEHRRRVSGESIAPLMPVFFIAPTRFVSVDIGGGTIVERHRGRSS